MTADLSRRPVAFTAEDGVTLRGDTIGSGPIALILVHEPGLDLDAWGAAPERLAREGFLVLAVDLRGHGASDGEPSPDDVAHDVAAAIGATGRSPDGTIVVSAGDSAAGSTAAAVIARTAGIVLLSPAYTDTSPRPLERVLLPSLAIVDATSRDWVSQVSAVQASLIGWRMLVHAGTTDRGSAMLGGSWGSHAEEQIRAFARQAARSRGQ